MSAREQDQPTSLQVIGAGFGRTGTLSLKAALERLGFDKCHHMVEVIQNPSTATQWVRAADGEPVDWRELLAGYQACVDWPSCTFYRELMEAFPEAKVVLSVRDPARWYESVQSTIYQLSRGTPRWLRWFVPAMDAVVRVAQATAWRTFNERFEDKDYAIAVFNAHIEEVKRVVPPERLLVFEVKQGWAPLCEFLDVPTPDEPFPHLNDREAMRARLRVMKVLRWAGPLLALTLLAVVLVWLWSGAAAPALGPTAVFAASGVAV